MMHSAHFRGTGTVTYAKKLVASVHALLNPENQVENMKDECRDDYGKDHIDSVMPPTHQKGCDESGYQCHDVEACNKFLKK